MISLYKLETKQRSQDSLWEFQLSGFQSKQYQAKSDYGWATVTTQRVKEEENQKVADTNVYDSMTR